MNYRIHALTGSLCGLLFIHYFSLPLWYKGAVIYSLVVIGSLLPDIDIPTSYLGRRLKPLSILINLIFSHRGFTHSLLFCFFVYLFSLIIGLEFYGVAVVIGVFSHILIDLLTKGFGSNRILSILVEAVLFLCHVFFIFFLFS